MLNRLEYGAVCLLMLFAAAAVLYSNVPLQGAGLNAAVALAAVLLFLLLCAERPYGWLAGAPGAWLARLPGLKLLLPCGLLLQGAVALLTAPVLTDDQRMYLQLAASLAQEQRYLATDGTMAFWPPGMPLFLSPFVALLGAGAAAVVAANLTLYGLGAWAIHGLGQRLGGEAVARLAVGLFTLWPSRLLSAGLAAKEGLVISAMLLGTLAMLKAFEAGRRGPLYALVAGAVFGLASLAQPGLLLYVLVLCLPLRHEFAKGRLRFALNCALVLACVLLTLQVWQQRNCRLFEGAFCGVSTNGGSVFYRANNPLATGSWTPDGEVKISHLPELEQNRRGYELGRQWIETHPRDFLVLGVRKLIYLMGDDSEGAYRGIWRASGLSHEQADQANSSARWQVFLAAHLASLLFWVWVLMGVFRYARAAFRDAGLAEQGRLLIYPLLYSSAVFFVFESGARQHMAAEGLMLVLAALAAWRARPEAAAVAR